MKKKLFTLFLALCMVLTLMPVSVLADTSGGMGKISQRRSGSTELIF